MKQLVLAAVLLSLVLDAGAQSGTYAYTSDGRRVLLKTDQTWEYVQVESKSPEDSVVLSVTEVVEMDTACRLQIKLVNNLGYRINSLVPRLSVRNAEGIVFTTKSLSYSGIRPTEAKYTNVQFTGIGCRDISQVWVSDASRCKMGEIDQFNEKEGECLSHVYVEPSDLISISK
jgi:hypothetical protein